MLDLVLFRADQGGDPDKIRELQKKRFKDVAHVDMVVELDTKWRKREILLSVYACGGPMHTQLFVFVGSDLRCYLKLVYSN